MSDDLRALSRPRTWRDFRLMWQAFRRTMADADEKLAEITADLANLTATQPDRAVIDEVRDGVDKLEERLRERP